MIKATGNKARFKPDTEKLDLEQPVVIYLTGVLDLPHSVQKILSSHDEWTNRCL